MASTDALPLREGFCQAPRGAKESATSYWSYAARDRLAEGASNFGGTVRGGKLGGKGRTHGCRGVTLPATAWQCSSLAALIPFIVGDDNRDFDVADAAGRSIQSGRAAVSVLLL